MPPGSTLRVLGRIDGAHAVVNFMDASPGTDAPRLGHCFDAASTRNDGDAIANVALCAQIVSDHRGRIYAAPSPLGSLGITLRLPLRLQVHTISPRSSRKVGAAPLAQEIADGREITPD
jgi:two-component system sensor histidine kinase BaeS